MDRLGLAAIAASHVGTLPRPAQVSPVAGLRYFGASRWVPAARAKLRAPAPEQVARNAALISAGSGAYSCISATLVLMMFCRGHASSALMRVGAACCKGIRASSFSQFDITTSRRYRIPR